MTLSGEFECTYEPGISWEVRATLDIPDARDVRAVREIVVVKPSGFVVPYPLPDALHQPFLKQAQQDECFLAISLSRGYMQSHGVIEGVLYGEIFKDMNASEVIIKLTRIDYYEQLSSVQLVDTYHMNESVIGEMVLDRKSALKSGEKREWPFRLDVERLDVLNMNVDYVTTRWVLKGLVNVPRRSDPFVEVVVDPDESIAVSRQHVITKAKYRECLLTLTVLRDSMHSYSVLEGILHVDILKDIKVSKVKIKLTRSEAFGDAHRDFTVEEIILDSDIMCSAGENREWPFKLNIGQVNMPSLKKNASLLRMHLNEIDIPFSLRTDHTTVEWKVEGIIDIPRRLNSFIVQEITVDF